MTPLELKEQSGISLLDVRLADDFEAGHLEGAKNNCVFEVDFGRRLPDTLPDLGDPVVIYGANAGSQEAAAALEKMQRAGYTAVSLLEGGFDRALEEGFTVIAGDPIPSDPTIPDGALPLDLEESQVEWTGRNLVNKHFGTVPIRTGDLVFHDGQLQSGTISLDLLGLTCTDLAESEYHDVLIAHLHNEDFFDLENHPETKLEIRKADVLAEASPGSPNLRIQAGLSIRGQTHPIEIYAVSGITSEGKAAAQATFAIDRTRWGILYGSGKFFHRLAGHLVNDLIEFQVRLLTR